MGKNLQAFETYLTALRKTPLDQKTEHMDRTHLQTLLDSLAPPGITIQHEPKHAGDHGSPDFKITKSGAIVGYVEVKKIGANLTEVKKSKQIEKYKSLSKNILLTDYLHFAWLDPDAQQTAALIHPLDLENPKHKLNPDRADEVGNLLAAFFSTAPEKISRAQDLALALATRAHLLRDGLLTELARQEKDHTQGKLYGLLGAFRTQVFHDLTLAEFADAFAQTLAYGLFLARLNTEDVITLKNAPDFIPAAFPLIRELVNFLSELEHPDYAQIRWIVQEILSIMNSLNLAEIRQDLSFSNRKAKNRKTRAGSEEEHRLFERDPFVYFYEDFLAKYDAKLRKSRAVYYTPPPVVNFIIRAIDDILKTEFAIPTGLADHNRVTMLDFATGTGTFILEALEKMFETIGDSPAKRDLLIREHMLKNIFGFEYLIAPYTIAHLKLSQYLADKGHRLSGTERFQVYLTNTLEPIAPQSNFLLPALSAEADAAQEIKKKPILVITGNPPYSGESKNKGAWISGKINAYKFVDGKPLGERNPKWLNDDYVKFIRFAQDKIDQVPEDIVGIITNHSFIDNPTFRGMRQSLMKSFNKIFVIDLHGNAKKKEKSPDGTKDENIFDIEQGVAISIFIKTKKPESRLVWRSDLWGTRLGKYESCARLSLNPPSQTQAPAQSSSLRGRVSGPANPEKSPQQSEHVNRSHSNKGIDWRCATPSAPFYFFERGDAHLETEYRIGNSVADIFPMNVLGFQTHRDDFAIAFTKVEIEKRLSELRDASMKNETIREKYHLEDNRDWSLADARLTLSTDALWESSITQCVYRPFDRRWCQLSDITMDFPRTEFIKNCINRQNLYLGVGRAGSAIPERTWELVVTSEHPIDANIFRRGGCNAFPLYIHHAKNLTIPPPPPPTNLTFLDEPEPPLPTARKENISSSFRTSLIHKFGAPQFTPEQIFGYIFAILHAPTYRTLYAEFLRGDFPRIPLCATRENFENLATLGWNLAQKHLLKQIPTNKVKFLGKKTENLVEKPHYSPAEQAIYINATNHFAPVPEAVWNFYIGGYQVIEKYLKSRKGRTLTLDEVTTIENIVAVLAFTITQMETIDDAYRKAFPSQI